MQESTVNTRIALSLMGLVIALNTGLAINLVVAGGSGLARAFNGQNIFLLAALQMVLVLVAYITCKNPPIPLRR